MDIETAKDIILKLPKYLIPTGSYRRGLNHINDLDFLTTHNLFTIVRDIDFPIEKINSLGSKYLSIIIEVNEKPIKIDIWRVTKENLPFAQFSRTGSSKFNIRTRAQAKYLGYKLTDSGLFDANNKRVNHKFNNEREIFKFLNVTYKKPSERNE